MPKTLADMTPEGRAECVGMWHDTIFGLVILEKLQEDPEEGDPFGLFRHPRTGAWHTEDFTGVTPRFDLPRAWTPDGTPPKGEWSYANDAMGEFGNISEDEVQEFLDDGDPSFERRWVGEWEKMQ